jgi:tape measure domain-containing protein
MAAPNTIAGVNVNLTLQTAAFQRNIQIAVQKTQQATQQINRNLGAMQQGFVQTGRQVTQFANGLKSMFALQMVLDAAQAVAAYSDSWQMAGNKIAAAAQISGAHVRSLSEVSKIAIETRSSLDATADLYSKLTRVAGDLGAAEEDVARATKIVAQGFKAGGASTLEMENGIRQLAQALGSGILQGDELRSIRENAPLIAKAIAKEFGTTVAGLKKLGAEGELTSERVFQAVLKSENEIGAAFGRTNATIAESFGILNVALTEYIGKANQHSGASTILFKASKGIAENFGEIAGSVLNLIPGLTTVKAGFAAFEYGKGVINKLNDRPIVDLTQVSEDLATQFSHGLLPQFTDAELAVDSLNGKFQKIITTVNSLETAGSGHIGDFLNTTTKGFKQAVANFDGFAPPPQQNAMMDEYKESIIKSHDGIIKGVRPSIEEHAALLERIKVQYSDAGDRARATAIANQAYNASVRSQAESLGAVYTAQEKYIARQEEIAISDMGVEERARASAGAALEYKNALDAQQEALGVSLSPMQEHDAVLRQIEASNLSAANAAMYHAQANAQLMESQLAVNNSVGLSTSPYEAMNLQLAKIDAAYAANKISATQVTQAQIGAYAGLGSAVMGVAGEVTGAFKGLFKDNKALAIADAVINTAAAIMKTLAQTGATPWGLAMAGVAAAVGAAQIATIASTQPGSSKSPSVKGGGGGGGKKIKAVEDAGKSSTSSSSGMKEAQLKQNVTLIIEGDSFSPEHFKKMVVGLNGVIADGAVLRVANR